MASLLSAARKQRHFQNKSRGAALTTAPKGVWTDQIAGRFRKITVHQIAMAWWAHQAGHITKRQLRIWFAAHEMAERRRYTNPANGPERPLYTLDEIKALVGGRGSKSADAELSADVHRLGLLGLVRIQEHAIEFAVSIDQLSVDDTDGFWSMFNLLPHPRRSVPVPRRVLRALAAGFTRGMTAVVLATLIRSLFWHKNPMGGGKRRSGGAETGEGTYRIDGRTKREWISEVFGVSARTVTDARARLIELGWLVPLETPQWLLNRYGTHDAINTEWDPRDLSACESSGGVEDGGEPSCAPESLQGESASPSAEFPGESASPDLNKSLPLTGNLKTRKPAQPSHDGRSGSAGASLCSAVGGRKKKKGGKPGRVRDGEPNIRDVQAGDLRDIDRLLELHRQAVVIGLASDSESGRLDFLALAERARARGKRAGALFFWLLREKKTVFITNADEERAAGRLRSHYNGERGSREQWGGCGDESVPRSPRQPPEFSDDEKLVAACLRVAQQRRIDDPYTVARQLKEWPREQWDTALREFTCSQHERWAGVGL